MRVGVTLALLGALIVSACDDGATVQDGATAETADANPDAEEGIQVTSLSSEDQEAELLDTEAAESIPREPNGGAELEVAPLVVSDNELAGTDELPTRQNVELAPEAAESSSDTDIDLEQDVEATILELVVRTQEEGGDPQAPSETVAGGAELETASVLVPSEAQSGQPLAADGAQEHLTSNTDGEQPLNGPDIASADDDDGLSDEQDFEAVSNRETIESDAERLKAQETERKEFIPVPLPERVGVSNVALFALRTTHDVGTEVYERIQLFVFEVGVRNRCAEYPDSEAAQHAFLDAGGPEKDELRIDPDGDGFVCGWNPDVYRALLK